MRLSLLPSWKRRLTHGSLKTVTFYNLSDIKNEVQEDGANLQAKRGGSSESMPCGKKGCCNICLKAVVDGSVRQVWKELSTHE